MAQNEVFLGEYFMVRKEYVFCCVLGGVFISVSERLLVDGGIVKFFILADLRSSSSVNCGEWFVTENHQWLFQFLLKECNLKLFSISAFRSAVLLD